MSFGADFHYKKIERKHEEKHGGKERLFEKVTTWDLLLAIILIVVELILLVIVVILFNYGYIGLIIAGSVLMVLDAVALSFFVSHKTVRPINSKLGKEPLHSILKSSKRTFVDDENHYKRHLDLE